MKDVGNPELRRLKTLHPIPAMDIEYNIDAAHKRVIIHPIGDADLESCKGTILKIVSDPAFKPDYKVLCDWRRSGYSPTPNEILSLGRFLSRPECFGASPLAIVVSSKGRAAARLVALTAEAWGGRVAVFASIQRAEAWLSSFDQESSIET